jgi:hypothetical protein
MPMINNQNSGDGSTNLQAARDIVVNNDKTIALYSVEEVAKQLLSSVFGELPDDTKKQIQTNQKSFFNVLSENLEKIVKQNEELKDVVSSPDFQYISKKATISASRSSSTDLHKNLSSLLVQRINNDKDDLKRIVYNEAISTVTKLTNDQLKIITLCYILRYTSYNGIVSWETLDKYLDFGIKPFLGFKNTNAEFQHIEYAGCGAISIGSWNFIDNFKRAYTNLFLNLVEKNQIDVLTSINSIRHEFLALDTKEDKYLIRFKNTAELENFLKEKNIDADTIIKFKSIYDAHIDNNDTAIKKISEKTNVGGELLGLWNKSNLEHLSLTSVGIAIGASYYEQTTGFKVDIGIWIN